MNANSPALTMGKKQKFHIGFHGIAAHIASGTQLSYKVGVVPGQGSFEKYMGVNHALDGLLAQ